MLMNYILSMIFLLTSISFYTIMERKLLGSFHIRIGPNKLGMMGLFQPFSDAIKLFSKNINFLMKINIFIWNFSPVMIFFMLLLFLMFLPINMEINNFQMNLIFLLFLLGLPTFVFFLSSFFSFSKFNIISSKRLIVQMLSYEICLMLILIVLLPLFLKINLESLIYKLNILNSLKYFLGILFFILILTESSRIPFDFVESESELVSGFNTEYSSTYFSMFFIYEYGMMLFFSILMSYVFLNFILSFLLIFLFIHIRSSFPRLRYDQMMMFFWKNFLMFNIFLLLLFKIY